MLNSIYRRGFSGVKAFSRNKKIENANTVPVNFVTDVDRLFSIIETTLRPMLKDNKDFELTIKPQKEIRLKVGESERGAYIFTSDPAEEVIRVNYPYCGGFEYHFDMDSRQWISTIDKHDLRGMITRELLKHCIGCPLFP